MKNVILGTLCAAIALVAVACSSTNPVDTFARNLTAAECDNQAAFLANVPLTFVTPAQASEILAGTCASLFGTAPAPTPAAGSTSVFSAPTPAPTATPAS